MNVFKTLEEEEYTRMEKLIIIFGLVLFFIVLIVGIGALMAFPTCWMVNAIFSEAALVAVFGGKIDFWSAWGLNILCGLLFKSSSVSTKKD